MSQPGLRRREVGRSGRNWCGQHPDRTRLWASGGNGDTRVSPLPLVIPRRAIRPLRPPLSLSTHGEALRKCFVALERRVEMMNPERRDTVGP